MMPPDENPPAAPAPDDAPPAVKLDKEVLYEAMIQLAQREDEDGRRFRERILSSPLEAMRAARDMEETLGLATRLPEGEILVFLPDPTLTSCSVLSLEAKPDAPPSPEFSLHDYDLLGYFPYRGGTPR